MAAKRKLLGGLLLLVSWLGVARQSLAGAVTAGRLPLATEASLISVGGQEGPTQAGADQQGTTDQPDMDQTVPPVEQHRHLSRRFAVGKAGRAFAIDTRYGRVQLNAWNKQEIKVETDLVARAETPAAAAQILSALGVTVPRL